MFLQFIRIIGSIPFVPGMTQVLIQDEPDERNIEDALGSRTGTKISRLILMTSGRPLGSQNLFLKTWGRNTFPWELGRARHDFKHLPNGQRQKNSTSLGWKD